MKSSERRLLAVFFLLAAIMGGVLLSQRLLQWDHRLDRAERDLELAKMESDALISQASYWKASADWIQRTQPVAASGYDAGAHLVDTLGNAATAGGLSVLRKKVEEPVQTGYYKQFGVTFTVKGDLTRILGWIYTTLEPSAFYVVPRLKISPEKEDGEDVTAQVTFERRYTPEFAANGGNPSAPPMEAPPSLAPAPGPKPTTAPVSPFTVPLPAPLPPEVGNP